MVYTYDTWGNLATKKVYAYTTATNPGTPTSTITYSYGNSAWGDQLTSYNGQTITYDAMGNPTTYRGKTLTWRGKQLTQVSGTASYVYDSNGLRQRKTVSGTNTDYCYNGSVLIGLTKGSDKLRFSYDAAGQVQAVDFNGTYYYYLRNGQGDIVKIIDGSGNTVVEYAYDSWGKKLSCTGTLATTLGALNPFRYRGYVYDEETSFYYLKSRYYDPETCRFISADVYLSTGQGVIGHNCYAYCLNNSVYCHDPDGTSVIGTLLGVAIAVTVAGTIGGLFSVASGGSFKSGFASGAITSGSILLAGTIGIAAGLTGLALTGATAFSGMFGSFVGYLIECKTDKKEAKMQTALVRAKSGFLSGLLTGGFMNVPINYGTGAVGDLAEALTQYFVAVEGEGFVGFFSLVDEAFMNELGIDTTCVPSDLYQGPFPENLLGTE